MQRGPRAVRGVHPAGLAIEAASLPVTLNGEEVGRVEVGPQPDPGFLARGGRCAARRATIADADLAIGSDGGAVLTGSDRLRNATLFTNSGSLTSSGRERIDSAVAGLAGVTLQETYGCPDCADGGAAYLTLLQGRVDLEKCHGVREPTAGLPSSTTWPWRSSRPDGL